MLVKKGRPDSDFPLLVHISASNGSDMGDINHSPHFVPKFLSSLAEAVMGRWKVVLATPMVATGCRPPVNVLADKATHQRETRQLVGLVTLNPGGKELLIPVFLGAPKCPKGDGEYLKDNIVKVVDSFINKEQLVGFTGDGVYTNCKVADKLGKHYNIRITNTWDQMHLAATVDTSMRNPKKHGRAFEWLNNLTAMVGKGVKFVAWGQNWHYFFGVCEEMEKQDDYDFKSYRPCSFSETKFANSAALVYKKFRSVYPALLVTLEKVKEDFYEGKSTEKEKAEKADEVQGGIMNYLFGLSLSAANDAYDKVGAISNVLQIVDILPHERYDKFKRLLDRLNEMAAHINLGDCPCQEEEDREDEEDKEEQEEEHDELDITLAAKGEEEKVCYWPSLHKDTKEVLQKGKYRGVVLGQLTTDPTRTRAGTEEASQWLTEDRKTTAFKAFKRAVEMVTFLSKGLEEKVYSSADIIMINHARKLLNISSDMIKIKTSGAVSVSTIGWRSFRSAAMYFEPAVLTRVPEEELRLQYREYCRRLEQVSKRRGGMELSSKEIFSLLLNPKENLYKDIEGVLSVMARACVTQGVEATVESWVSVMENHCSKVRGITDQVRLENEVKVAINGPEVQHCKGIVREAMRVREGGGNFIRRSSNIIPYTVSQAVDNLVKKNPRVPMM